MLKFTLPDVVAAVRSLYADELKPFGRVLLKRLRELAAAGAARGRGLPADALDPEVMPRVDPKRLRRICETSKELRVMPEEGREYSVLLAGQPAPFLDVCSTYDPYPAELWVEVAAYFEGLTDEDDEKVLPGGRYAAARVLAARSLAFLRGCSLGQVCHIVQLAISQRRLLGYQDGQLVPYRASDECIKEQCAYNQQPVQSKKASGETSLPVASWEEARECLRSMLHSDCGPEPGVVTLSNVKRLFRSRFHLELSETVLGHSRLYELLLDPRFHGVCRVEAQGNGHMVVRLAGQRLPRPCPVGLQAPAGCRREAADRPARSRAKTVQCLSTVPMQPVQPILPSSPMTAPPIALMTGGQQLPRPQQQHAAPPPVPTICMDTGHDCDSWELVSPGATPRGAASPVPSPSPSPSKPFFPAEAPPACGHINSSTASAASTADGSSPDGGGAGSSSNPGDDEATQGTNPPPPPPLVADEDVAAGDARDEELEEPWTSGTAAVAPPSHRHELVALLSPCARARRCHAVKNTFIDIGPAGPSALAALGAARRCASVPKDFGSGTSGWEAECHALLATKPRRPSPGQAAAPRHEAPCSLRLPAAPCAEPGKAPMGANSSEPAQAPEDELAVRAAPSACSSPEDVPPRLCHKPADDQAAPPAGGASTAGWAADRPWRRERWERVERGGARDDWARSGGGAAGHGHAWGPRQHQWQQQWWAQPHAGWGADGVPSAWWPKKGQGAGRHAAADPSGWSWRPSGRDGPR